VKLAPFGVTTLNFDIFYHSPDLIFGVWSWLATHVAARFLGIRRTPREAHPVVAPAACNEGDIVTKR
jgi:hypothetical protein